MNKELKSLLILSLFTLQFGVADVLADGPISYEKSRASGYKATGSNSQSAAMGEYAGVERTQAAIGHYARARTLLVEAMREFDAGKEIARPDLILNSETWKAGVSARADELAHVISPQGRETTGGVRFKESQALLNQKFDKPKKVASSSPAPRPIKKVEKEKRQILVSAEKKETNTARARMAEESEPLAVKSEEKKELKVIREPLEPVAPKEEVKEPVAKSTEEQKDLKELLSPPQSSPIEADPELEKAADEELARTMGEKVAEDKSPPSDTSQTTASPSEQSETAKSINDEEIRARLKKLSEEIAQEEKNKQ
jgi:hypothetical protein